MADNITLRVELTLTHKSGPASNVDTLLDALAAQVGRQNGAGSKALRVKAYGDDVEGPMSVYEIDIVDDIKPLRLSVTHPEREQLLHDLHVHDPSAGYDDPARWASTPITELRKTLDNHHQKEGPQQWLTH